MVARLIAIAVALVVTGAPVVTTVCEGLCAARDEVSGRAGEHHSCHQQTPAASETGVTSSAHNCGHSDEGPSAVGQSLWLFAAPAVVVHSFAFAPPSLDAPWFDGASDRGPPLVSARSTQLRI
jgi:hypothetical protein